METIGETPEVLAAQLNAAGPAGYQWMKLAYSPVGDTLFLIKKVDQDLGAFFSRRIKSAGRRSEPQCRYGLVCLFFAYSARRRTIEYV